MPKLDDEKLGELIQAKITAGDADSGWFIAQELMELKPILTHIANSLTNLDHLSSSSGSLGHLAHIEGLLKKLVAKMVGGKQ
jgi:hypothetical protein